MNFLYLHMIHCSNIKIMHYFFYTSQYYKGLYERQQEKGVSARQQVDALMQNDDLVRDARIEAAAIRANDAAL